MSTLLGVDLGLRTGLALYSDEGKLLFTRCRQLKSNRALKSAVHAWLKECDDLAFVFVEGDKRLGDIWQKEANKLRADTFRVAPETWRPHFFYPREMSDKHRAKEHAERYAALAIEKLAVQKPTSLRTDAAEAILIGLYGLKKVGWVTDELGAYLRQP